MNDPLCHTDIQASAVRSLFQTSFLTESHVCNVSYRCSCNYDYSSQYRWYSGVPLASVTISHMPSKATSYQDHQDSFHPSVFPLVHLLWEQNAGFLRLLCDFEDHLGSQVVHTSAFRNQHSMVIYRRIIVLLLLEHRHPLYV